MIQRSHFLITLLLLSAFFGTAILPCPAYALAPQPYFTEKRKTLAVEETVVRYIERVAREIAVSAPDTAPEHIAALIADAVPLQSVDAAGVPIGWTDRMYAVTPGQIEFYLLVNGAPLVISYDTATRTAEMVQSSGGEQAVSVRESEESPAPAARAVSDQGESTEDVLAEIGALMYRYEASGDSVRTRDTALLLEVAPLVERVHGLLGTDDVQTFRGLFERAVDGRIPLTEVYAWLRENTAMRWLGVADEWSPAQRTDEGDGAWGPLQTPDVRLPGRLSRHTHYLQMVSGGQDLLNQEYRRFYRGVYEALFNREEPLSVPALTPGTLERNLPSLSQSITASRPLTEVFYLTLVLHDYARLLRDRVPLDPSAASRPDAAQHRVGGAFLARDLLERFGFDRFTIETVALLIRLHDAIWNLYCLDRYGEYNNFTTPVSVRGEIEGTIVRLHEQQAVPAGLTDAELRRDLINMVVLVGLTDIHASGDRYVSDRLIEYAGQVVASYGESSEEPAPMSWGAMIRQTVAPRVRFYEELIAVEEAARQEPETTGEDLRGRIRVLIEGVRNDPALQTVRRVDREFFDRLSEDFVATAETTVHRFQRFLRVRTLERELSPDEMDAVMSWIEERLGPLLREFLPEGRDPAQMYDRELRIVLVRDLFQGAFGLSWEQINASLERVRAVLSTTDREGDEIMSPREIAAPFDVVIWMLLNGHTGPLCSMAALSGREQEALAAVYRDILADRDLFDAFREDWRSPDIDTRLKHALVDELVGAERGERVDAVRGMFFEVDPLVLREILSLVRDLQAAGFGARLRGLAARQKEEGQGESAETVTTAYEQYAGSNQEVMHTVAKTPATPLLLRVPVEYLDTVPASALQWLLTLSNAPTSSVCVELYTLDDPDAVIPVERYDNYGITPRSFTAERTRTNTVTLFLSPEAAEGELLRAVQAQMQTSLALQRSILVPVGMTDDALGLVRASILGMRLARIARQPDDEAFIAETAAQYAALIASYGIEPPRLTAADVRALAVSGDINTVARILALLLGSLPAERVPAGRIEQIYENAVFVLNMA